MNCVFGISYGNSTASVALYKEDGRVDIIANDAGDRATGTSVFISQSEKVVGLATGGNVSRVNSTVTRNKSLLEPLSEGRFALIKSSLVVKVEMNGDRITYKVQDGDTSISITPQEVAVIIFRKLLSIGQSAVGEVKLSCVIAVPQYWDANTRLSIQQSAEKAGWNVLQLISEPTSALLAYQPQLENSCLALVFRVGGYSCEATVIRVVSGYYQILGSERRDKGVRDVVDTVCRHLADEFRRKTKLEPTESRKCMCKLMCASESMVRTLSTLPTSSLYLESLCEGVDFTAGLSRARLDSMLSPVVPQLVEPIHQILSNLQLSPTQIDKVVCVGGGMNIPRLSSEITSIFSNTDICDFLQPQEVTAIGAANQGGLLMSAFQNSVPVQFHQPRTKLRILKSPLSLKLSTGEETKLEGALPLSKTLTVSLEDNTCLQVDAQLDSMTGQARFEGFDSVPTPLRVCFQMNEAELELSVTDMSTNVSQSSFLILTPS